MTSRRRFFKALAGLTTLGVLAKVAPTVVEATPKPIVNQYVTRYVSSGGSVHYQILIPVSPTEESRHPDFMCYEIVRWVGNRGVLLGQFFADSGTFLAYQEPHGYTYRIYARSVDWLDHPNKLIATFDPWATT